MKTSVRIIALAAITTIGFSAFAGGHNKITADVNDPVTLRINIMQNNGALAGLSSGMLKGEIPFDPLTAQAALTSINTAALGLVGLFPAVAEEDLRSTAGPTVWSDPAGFRSAIAKFIADSGAAKSSAPATLEEFKVAFSNVAANCQSCHKSYRIKR